MVQFLHDGDLGTNEVQGVFGFGILLPAKLSFMEIVYVSWC